MTRSTPHGPDVDDVLDRLHQATRQYECDFELEAARFEDSARAIIELTRHHTDLISAAIARLTELGAVGPRKAAQVRRQAVVDKRPQITFRSYTIAAAGPLLRRLLREALHTRPHEEIS